MVGGTLALKLRRRKHMASGAFLRRSSCCGARDPVGEDFHMPKLLCPAFSVRPVVRGRVVVGELMFPFAQLPNIIRRLRSWGAILNWPAADKPGEHSTRRVAARALMSAGGTFAQLLRAGKRHGNAVRSYLDLGEDERRATTDILIEDSDGEPS